jgi:hypothetical protein
MVALLPLVVSVVVIREREKMVSASSPLSLSAGHPGSENGFDVI